MFTLCLKYLIFLEIVHECLCKESGCNNNFENAGDQGGGDETTSEHPATRLKVGCIPVVPSYLFL